MLWLYPDEYGLRIRDGQWIKGKKANNSPKLLRICRTRNIQSYLLSSANIGDIVFDISSEQFYVYGGYGNRLCCII